MIVYERIRNGYTLRVVEGEDGTFESVLIMPGTNIKVSPGWSRRGEALNRVKRMYEEERLGVRGRSRGTAFGRQVRRV